MPRGRPRSPHPTQPSHICPTLIPRGIYWDPEGQGRWYAVEELPDGKRRRKTIAGAEARLSDLIAFAERRDLGSRRGSVDRVMAAYMSSTSFAQLAPRTRADYERYQQFVSHMRMRNGDLLGQLEVDRLTRPVIQRIVEKIAADGHPTKANHFLRYLRRVLNWGVNHGECTSNPCAGVTQAKEKGLVRIPSQAIHQSILQFARSRGALPPRSAGSLPPYLWLCMEFAYLCRLRGIEVITLSDENILDEGLLTNRRKGSRDAIMVWHERLQAAVQAALAVRTRAYERRNRPTPIAAKDRWLIVAEDGSALTRSALDTAWQRMMRLAVAEGVIRPEERFGLHAMKHLGISATAGNQGDKQAAGGHKTPAMTARYDHELPTIGAPRNDFYGDFSRSPSPNGKRRG